MKDVMKKFRNFQDEVFGSGLNGVCLVKTYRNGPDMAVEISVWFSNSAKLLSYEWNNWRERPESEWEEFKEQVRAKL